MGSACAASTNAKAPRWISWPNFEEPDDGIDPEDLRRHPHLPLHGLRFHGSWFYSDVLSLTTDTLSPEIMIEAPEQHHVFRKCLRH
jgi:hypothetical protein